MKLGRTRLSHVEYVLDNISDQNRAEHERLGLNKFELLKHAKDFMQHGVAYTGFVENTPVFVFGIILGEQTTWFMATQQYWDLGAGAVIHARRFVREMRRRYGRLITGTCSPHPDVDRWFKLLGYKKTGEEAGIKWFEMT